MKDVNKKSIKSIINGRKQKTKEEVVNLENAEELEKVRLNEKYNLNLKLEEFIKWALTSRAISRTEEVLLRNFIEKMAIWYEFRYTEDEIKNIFLEKEKFQSVVDIINKSEAYKDLLYFNDLKENDLTDISWKDMFDTKTFLNTLSEREKLFLKRPGYMKTHTSLTNEFTLELSREGTITNISFAPYHTCGEFDKEILRFKNKNILELVNFLNSKKMHDDISHLVNIYYVQCEFKEKLLDSVMYRIIERGGEEYGSKRGFLYALEIYSNHVP